MAQKLFADCYAELGLLPEQLPESFTVEKLGYILCKKVFHAKCGATFRRAVDMFTIKASVSLRAGLKATTSAQSSTKEVQQETVQKKAKKQSSKRKRA